MAKLSRQSRAGRYLFAGGSVLAAVFVTLVVAPLLRTKAPLFVFAIAVIASAWFGGLGPGLLATGMSIAVVAVFLIPRVFSLFPMPPGPMLLGLFGLLGIVISVVAQNLLSAAAKLADAKERLQRANEELSRSNEELQRFASAVSHDLRQPLRTVRTYTELLMERLPGNFEPDLNEIASLVVEGAEQMQTFIDGLLEYSKVSEDAPEQNTRTDLNLSLNLAVRNLKSAIDESEALITSESLPTVIANHGRMTQVFQNLIDNAIKYRGANSPQIHVSAKQEGDHWLISISDNGIGIDQKHHDRVFGVFQRLHAASEYQGAGIGLAMVKRIVERHGGRIWVESKPGEGSTFYFTIPSEETARSSNA